MSTWSSLHKQRKDEEDQSGKVLKRIGVNDSVEKIKLSFSKDDRFIIRFI